MCVDIDGEFYREFVSRTGWNGYSLEDRQCIQGAVERLGAVETSAERPGMLLGKIQSGKTKTFLGIIALAFDNGFDVAVVLTKGTKALTKQTLQRIRGDFARLTAKDAVQIHDIMTVPGGLTGFELAQKLIFVAKKQSDNLDPLRELIRTTYPALASKRALIVDDEADYASVGFKNSQATGLQANVTTQRIDNLRSIFRSSAFLQVTATPYSLYLQPDAMTASGIEFRPLRPAFTELVPVGQGYVGSDFYFDESRDQDSVAAHLYEPVTTRELEVLKQSDRRRFKIEDCLTSSAISTLRDAICNFIVGGVIRRLQDERAGLAPQKYCFLVHTEVGKAAHAWQEQIVIALKKNLAEATDGAPETLRRLLDRAYDDLALSITLMEHDLPPRQVVLQAAFAALRADWVMITKVNSEKQVEELLDKDGQLRLRTPLNVFIGGQILDRGITVANLIGFFYGRRPNVYQQDTVLQHSRMFGFRPIQDVTVTRFYTEPLIYDAMRRVHESDVALRAAISKNPDSPVVFIQRDAAGRVVPCSPNKILISRTTTLPPFKRILPVGFQTDYAVRLQTAVKNIDRTVGAIFGDAGFETPVRVPLTVAIDILKQIEPTLKMEDGYEFDWSGARASLEYLSDAAPDAQRGQVLLLVRPDRNLARFVTAGTGQAFSDAPDTSQGEGVIARCEAIDVPMLMLFRQNGAEAQGWKGTPFYWPVIWVPTNARTAVFSHTTP